ncbi:unnamed protein product [Brassica rapa]|uniref:Peptidase A1 domain-containing protein n=2 Tax=Brassica TaxID=3705 RepID=A0A3P5YGV2_BRACM|nr:unnamed protein product [Brassica napus]CAG7865843.1 unnamed protein product [Brassica rapa]VDC62884.1 unnamed protein product [Brassica rapa]
MMLGPMGNLVMVGPQEFVVYRRVVPRQFYINLPYDGFVGLGLPLPANIDAVGAVPIWMTLMNQGLLRINLFSLYLRNYYFHGNDGGSLIFGGVSQEHYEGHHQYFDLVDNSNQWKIHMYSVSVAGHLAQYCDKVLIDSGCEYIYGPPHIIYRINRQILGREVPLYGPTILTHDEAVGILDWPHVSFNFIEGDEDASLTIPPENYVIADADGRYISAFRPLVFQPGDEAYFVLGLPWLRRYHTVFDFGQERIGFALAKLQVSCTRFIVRMRQLPLLLLICGVEAERQPS